MVLDAYEVADPVIDDTVGKSTDSKLAGLHGEPVASGDPTLTDALTAGPAIEDMDLADVYRLLEPTSNPPPQPGGGESGQTLAQPSARPCGCDYGPGWQLCPPLSPASHL